MTLSEINIITAIAILAVVCDLVFQILKVTKRHSSLDVSFTGVIIRTLAALVILLKFVSVKDKVLIAGQTAIAGCLIIYTFLVFKYHKKHGRKK